jgi:hypothetical protein
MTRVPASRLRALLTPGTRFLIRYPGAPQAGEQPRTVVANSSGFSRCVRDDGREVRLEWHRTAVCQAADGFHLTDMLASPPFEFAVVRLCPAPAGDPS